MMLKLADYEWYKNEYGGIQLSEDEFTEVIGGVSGFLQVVTFGRAASSGLEMVKDAACAAAEEYVKLTKHGNIKSENVDGYSVTYQDVSMKDVNAAMHIAVSAYLGDTGLMKRV